MNKHTNPCAVTITMAEIEELKKEGWTIIDAPSQQGGFMFIGKNGATQSRCRPRACQAAHQAWQVCKAYRQSSFARYADCGWDAP